MKRIIEIDLTDLEILKEFISNLNAAAKSFRYFNTREPSIISNHLVTLLMMIDGKPVAYGHLENEYDSNWLGICVLPKYSGKGHGTEMVLELIEKAKKLKLPSIELTVDKENFSAISLYKKMDFVSVAEFSTYHKFQLKLQVI